MRRSASAGRSAKSWSLPQSRGCRCGRTSVGTVRVYDGERLIAESPLVATRAVERPGFFLAGLVESEEHLPVIVTVTLNAALDRTLTVPNFAAGHRHRASQGLTLAGGKGINVARALKRLDVPVVATGLAGGRTGTRIVEELTAEAILNDFVRIADESRTSTAVVDPMGACSRRSTSGGRRWVRTSSRSCARRSDTSRAEPTSSSQARPRGVDVAFYADAIRELSRAGVSSVLDSEGEPLARRPRRGADARGAEPAGGRRARRAGAERRRGLPDGARRDRRPRRQERPPHT